MTKERVQPFCLRTEKRRAINAEGKPLFKPRCTELAPVSWKDRHREQRLFYEVGTYVPGLSLAIAQVEVIAWLAEAFLHAHPNGPACRNTGAGRSVALRTVLDSTSLFPFRLSPVSAAHLVAVSGRLDVLRHGLDQDLIMLRPIY